MIDPPKTRAEAEAYRYGQWAGNLKGHRFDPARCAYELRDIGGYIFHQCTNRNGKGPDVLYCGIHANKIAKDEARRAAHYDE